MGLEWVFIDTGLGFDMGIVRRELPSSNGTVCIYVYIYIHMYMHIRMELVDGQNYLLYSYICGQNVPHVWANTNKAGQQAWAKRGVWP